MTHNFYYISTMLSSDPDNALPTRMAPKAKYPDTVRAVYSLPDKAVVLKAARSIVNVSSARQGKNRLLKL